MAACGRHEIRQDSSNRRHLLSMATKRIISTAALVNMQQQHLGMRHLGNGRWACETEETAPPSPRSSRRLGDRRGGGEWPPVFSFAGFCGAVGSFRHHVRDFMRYAAGVGAAQTLHRGRLKFNTLPCNLGPVRRLLATGMRSACCQCQTVFPQRLPGSWFTAALCFCCFSFYTCLQPSSSSFA